MTKKSNPKHKEKPLSWKNVFELPVPFACWYEFIEQTGDEEK